MNEWMPKWKRDSWKKKNGIEIADSDLLEKIDKLCSKVKFTFILIDGKDDNMKSDKAYDLARKGSLKQV